MGAMPESVPVSCPVCRRQHVYAAPSYPCVCGAPVAPPLNRLSRPSVVTHRTWDDDWVAVRCGSCGREGEWPCPELDCPCGTILRVPVSEAPVSGAPRPDSATDGAGGRREQEPVFKPVTIRTAADAIGAAALCLRRLGHHDVRRAQERPPSGVLLTAEGMRALVEPTMRPASLRDVECLWLTALSESARCVCFSLAGYADAARAAADRLGVPLFVLDLTGAPQPVNRQADDLAAGLA
ncbi:hypothetical protein N8I84_31315 [Streptomyces cynarae]|uniref:Restriction endonuclease type IV Mrr domain-containing protein n=1 Tax=Streptomyces cynarae TaxID=2981134 RepID=A0ABY6E7P6_9ACTN|nr:hypothetical protein [Streptomyces cynarae]UXY22700.1 hypothetical protein N8I84_31315 [Streptomyces cynarae]